MQYAVAWAAADALERGELIVSIEFESYDISKPMTDIGTDLWTQFKIEVKDTLNKGCYGLNSV